MNPDRIVYSHTRAGLGILMFAAVWSGMVALICAFAFRDAPRPAQILLAVFAVAGVLILIGGVFAFVNGLRYGRSILILDHPVDRGGRLSGRVEPERVPESGDLRTSLSCVQRRGKRRDVFWTEQRAGSVARNGEKLFIPLRFDLPKDAPEADGHHTYWELALWFGEHANTSAMRCYFRIPVGRNSR